MSNYINMNDTVEFFKVLQKPKDMLHSTPILCVYGSRGSGKSLFGSLLMKASNLNTLVHHAGARLGKFERYAAFDGAELFILDDVNDIQNHQEFLKELSTSKTLPCDEQMVGHYHIRNNVRGIVCMISGPLDPDTEDRRTISTNVHTAFHALAVSVRD